MIGSLSMRSAAGGPRPGEGRVEAHKVISMYSEPPEDEITLDEFELFALDRLMVLRRIEDLRARGRIGEEFRRDLGATLAKYMNLRREGEGRREDARKDRISHFILRLAYCRTEELRRWFLNQESALFKHRVEDLGPRGMADFIQSNGLAFTVIDDDEKAAKRALLAAVPALPGTPLVDVMRTTYYKIRFEQAAALVGKRQVYVEGGWAYVPMQRAVTTVAERFRAGLSRSLIEASNAFAHVAIDTRFGPLLHNMNKQYVGRDFSNSGGAAGDAITPGQLDDLAQRSMPLCMRQLHRALRREHKLKHWGRLQYGLFLKGAGLRAEDAMAFWQAEFTKIMAYAYNVRHMYGKEGKRTNYTPYSCLKAIMGNPPGPGDHHGCPYRHYDEAHLAGLVSGLNLGPDDKNAVLGHAKGGAYQLACQRHFEATHKGYRETGASADGVGNHPNAWMHASMEYYKAKSGAAAKA
ncbi:unnamed protein product, partial [Phaeothamnion confervicola]